jgi:uncharacterized RDD family membrane protein YckC
VTVQAPTPSPDRLVSGDAVEFDIRVARLGSRALALMLDIMMEVVVFVLLALFILLALGVFGIDPNDSIVESIMVVCIVVSLIGYPTTVETLSGGRSVGKLAMGLRVVRDDGGPIRFRHALVRALVAVAVEWPGLVMPLVTWVASLWTMLVNPQGKRLGDIAAGTIVIHERTPAAWGWVPAMPPSLARWATALDLTGLSDDLALAVRHFLARNREIREPNRSRLGFALALEVAATTTPPPPPRTPGWAYLAAVLAERHRRSLGRLAAARIATAVVWPELLAATSVAAPPLPSPLYLPAFAPRPPAAPPPPMPAGWQRPGPQMPGPPMPGPPMPALRDPQPPPVRPGVPRGQ